jgi:hypothetical protein
VQAQRDAMFGEERVGRGVVELLPIVSLDALNMALKLSANEDMEGDESR